MIRLFLILWISVPAICSGQVAKVNATTPTTGFFQIFIALAVVIMLMLVAAWLFKRLGPITTGHKVPVKVIGGVNIGNRERVMVIEVGEQWIVIGVTANQINTLSTMPKLEQLPSDSANQSSENQFSNWLKKTIEKRSAASK